MGRQITNLTLDDFEDDHDKGFGATHLRIQLWASSRSRRLDDRIVGELLIDISEDGTDVEIEQNMLDQPQRGVVP